MNLDKMTMSSYSTAKPVYTLFTHWMKWSRTYSRTMKYKQDEIRPLEKSRQAAIFPHPHTPGMVTVSPAELPITAAYLNETMHTIHLGPPLVSICPW